MRRSKLSKPKEESRILETKADKIIFGVSVVLYAVVMLIEFKVTPMHNTISSSVAAFGIAVFLISKAIYIKKNRPPVFTREKLKFLAMPVIAVLLILSASYWLISRFLIK